MRQPIFAGTNTSKAAFKWNMAKMHQAKQGGFTFWTLFSKDKKQCWVYRVTPTKKKNRPKELIFPKTIKGAKLTRIGAVMTEGDPSISPWQRENECEFNKNVFNVYVEKAHQCDGYSASISKVKK